MAEKTEARALTDFDYQELDFTRTGFLNYIIRYGGGDDDSDTDPLPFAGLRKFVLDSSDQQPDAKEFFNKKFFSFSTSKQPLALISGGRKEDTQLPAALARETEQALTCPPFCKVTPIIEITNKDKTLIASNRGIVIGDTGVTAIIQDITIDKKPKAGTGTAGAVAVMTGRMTVEYSSRGKKTEILKAIAAHPETLGYMFSFGSENEYEVTLKNEKKLNTKFIGSAPRSQQEAAYEALTKARISYPTQTMRYGLVNWKPHLNRATFTFEFTTSTAKKDAIDKPHAPPPETPASATALQEATARAWKADLLAAIVKRLEKNKSLFSYSFMKKKQGRLHGSKQFFYRFARSGQTEEEFAGPQSEQEAFAKDPADYSSKGHGLFCLFRSLFWATVQTFYEETRILDPELVGDIFFDKEAYDSMFIGIQEDITPTTLKYAPFRNKDKDVRNTYETMVIDIELLTQFIGNLVEQHGRLTMTFLLEEFFNTLLPMSVKRNIKTTTGGVKGWLLTSDMPSFIGTAKMSSYLSHDAYKATDTTRHHRFLAINKDTFAARLKRSYKRDEVVLAPRPIPSYKHVTQFEAKVKADLWGANRFMRIPLSNINVCLATAYETGNAADVLLFQGDFPTTQAGTKNIHDTDARKINAKSPRALLAEGIIKVNWYDRKNPQKNANYRFVSTQNESPFKFTVLNNKDKENIKLGEGGKTPYLNQLHETSFSVYDYLGMEPYTAKFFFPPEFFGFESSKTDNFGVADSFGLVGVYEVNEVSIHYTVQKPMFIVSCKLTLHRQIEVQSFEEPKAASSYSRKLLKDAAGNVVTDAAGKPLYEGMLTPDLDKPKEKPKVSAAEQKLHTAQVKDDSNIAKRLKQSKILDKQIVEAKRLQRKVTKNDGSYQPKMIDAKTGSVVNVGPPTTQAQADKNVNELIKERDEENKAIRELVIKTKKRKKEMQNLGKKKPDCKPPVNKPDC